MLSAMRSLLGRRKLLASGTVLAMLAGLAVALAPPAAAGGMGACNYKLHDVPTKYRIGLDAPTPRISGMCTMTDEWWADFTVRRASTPHKGFNELYYEGCSPDWQDPYNGKCMDWYANTGEYRANYRAHLTIDKPGRWLIRPMDLTSMYWPGDDYDSFTARFPQKQFTVQVKYATTTLLQVQRKHGLATFTVTLTHYSPKQHAFALTRYAPVALQQKNARGEWVTIKTLHTHRHGTTTWTAHRANVKTYRAATADTKFRWGSASRTRRA